MNLFIKIIFIFIFFFSISGTSNSNEKIYFLNMEYVVKNSNAGKTIFDRINDINQKNIEELKKKENELKKIEENIKKKQNILSKEELDKEIINLRKKVNIFRDEKNNMLKSINETKNKELSKLYSQINPIIKSYMNTNNISILLDAKNIIAGKTESDITDDIVIEVNKILK